MRALTGEVIVETASRQQLLKSCGRVKFLLRGCLQPFVQTSHITLPRLKALSSVVAQVQFTCWEESAPSGFGPTLAIIRRVLS